MVIKSPNVGIAFAIVFGSGAATAIGASLVFFPTLLKLTTKRALGGALGAAAGVMLYVSFVEIFFKSVDNYAKAGIEERHAYWYGTLTFFLGVIVIMLLNRFTHWLLHKHHTGKCTKDAADAANNTGCTDKACNGCDDDDVEATQDMTTQSTDADAAALLLKFQKENFDPELMAMIEADRHHLMHVSLTSGIAIALHNFPEGIATFIAAIEDPAVGGVFAFAVAVHNIPEGFAVALPIYYATGDSKKAFMWGMLSGCTEPVAAFFAWIILSENLSYTAYAVIFGVVCGMMTMVSTQELLPAAHRYDPNDEVVSFSFVSGMAFMALSLCLFIV